MTVVAVVTGQEPAFEAASVRPNRDGGRVQITFQPGGRLLATNVTVRQLVRNAWGVHDLQLQGGPSWITRDTFDIIATAGRDVPLGTDDARPGRLQQMLQRLLVERFRVKVHSEQRVTDVYVLVRTRGALGPNLRPSTSTCLATPPCRRYANATALQAEGVTVREIASTLALRLGRPIIDETGLVGLYDAELNFTEESKAGLSAVAGPAGAAAIVTALQEQLGLKLESRRERVDVTVIDAAERPAPDEK
jgi:uncharacterized protein (TIGR03435 family)